MNKEISMLGIKQADLDAVVNFLSTHLLGPSSANATHACVLLFLPLHDGPVAPLVPAGMVANARGIDRKLTDRERRVLKGVADGLSNAQIASGLNTTVGSIKGAVQSLFRKLGVRPKRRSTLVYATLENIPPRQKFRSSDVFRSLTQIETSVLELLLEGQSNKVIAQMLQIPEIAVKATVRGMCTKAGVPNRVQLAKQIRQSFCCIEEARDCTMAARRAGLEVREAGIGELSGASLSKTSRC